MSSHFAAVVLCAGKGTRMKSARAKVLHEILGRPLAYYPVKRAFDLGAVNVTCVVGHQGDDVKAALTAAFPHASFATQVQQRGTGDAVRAAKSALEGYAGKVLILYGDVPLLTEDTLRRLLESYPEGQGVLSLVSCELADPTGYGRLVREGGQVKRIVEHKDATQAQREIREVNAGLYVVDAAFLWGALETLTPKNAQGELYLTDIVEQAAAKGRIGVVVASAEETAGVNDRVELAERAKVMQQRINQTWMRDGVTLVDPASTFIDDDVELGPDTILEPQVSLRAGTMVGQGVRIGQGAVVVKSVVGDGCEVKPYSVLEEAKLGQHCHVGPFARLRPGSELAEGVHVGNFVETKKAKLGKGTKAGHLAYLGDAVVGEGCNIGAGTITCNYDGVNKHITTLGDGVFIGSDSQLVAPVTVGDRAFVAAGTTVTEDVPAEALALSRVRQLTKLGWNSRKK